MKTTETKSQPFGSNSLTKSPSLRQQIPFCDNREKSIQLRKIIGSIYSQSPIQKVNKRLYSSFSDAEDYALGIGDEAKASDLPSTHWMRIENLGVILAIYVKSNGEYLDLSKARRYPRLANPNKTIEAHLRSSSGSPFLSGSIPVDPDRLFRNFKDTSFLHDLNTTGAIKDKSIVIARIKPPQRGRIVSKPDGDHGNDEIDKRGEFRTDELDFMIYKWDGKLFKVPAVNLKSFFKTLLKRKRYAREQRKVSAIDDYYKPKSPTTGHDTTITY